LGEEGDKLIKRALGHSDGSVTAIYNRYGDVREMRSELTISDGNLSTERVNSNLYVPKEATALGAREQHVQVWHTWTPSVGDLRTYGPGPQRGAH
jgi:hypothetical protein